MAVCVALQADGTLVPTGETVEACTGYVLASGAEYATQAVIEQAFAKPTIEDATQFFVAPFGTILVLYLIARHAGAVAGMFSGR